MSSSCSTNPCSRLANAAKPFRRHAVQPLHLQGQIRQRQQNGQRRPQFMAGDADERCLEGVGLPQLGVGQLQFLVLAAQVVEQLLAFLQQIVLLAGLVQNRQQLIGIPRLGDVAINMAFVDGVDDGLDVGVAGEEQTDGVGPIAANAAQKFDAADVRHALIGHDDVDRLFAQQAQPLAGMGGAEDAVFAAQQILQALHHIRLVIDNEQRVTGNHTPRLVRVDTPWRW
jgi:hypothetical protein